MCGRIDEEVDITMRGRGRTWGEVGEVYDRFYHDVSSLEGPSSGGSEYNCPNGLGTRTWGARVRQRVACITRVVDGHLVRAAVSTWEQDYYHDGDVLSVEEQWRREVESLDSSVLGC